MKKLHPALQCIAAALLLACSDRGSTEDDADGTPDEPAVEARAEQPSVAESAPAPSASVVDKLTCPSGCVKISATQPSPACCHCNGQDRSWKRSSWSATTWLCQ